MSDATTLARIDRYEVVRLLGKGGMGQVFLVRDTTLDRTVALKLLHPMAERDAESMRRFRLEFQAVAKLRHPNVVQLYDWGVYEGQSYFTMEFIQGTDIKAYLGLAGKKPLNASELNEPARLRRVVQVVAQTAAGLDYVHSQRIVHRDLKPANIMVDREGQVRVMDFGLLKRLDEEANAENPDLTRPGIILGTPAYLSPEQALGDRAVPQSDLYSLGIILYELLTGHRPFVSNRIGALIYCQIYEAPTPIRDFNPDVPSDLVAIVERLLRKEPQERFPTAGDLMRALLAAKLPESTERSGVMRMQEAARAELERREAQSYLADPHLVGRKEPMDLLLAMLGRLRKGLGDMVEITGEAGVGKTRLTAELARYAKLQKVRSFSGSFSEGEVVPYEGVRSILEQLSAIVAQKGDELAEKIFGVEGQVLAQEVPGFHRFGYISQLPPLAQLPPEQGKFRFFDAVAKVVDKFTRRFPMIFVLEHLQWADRISLELVSYLARNVIGPSKRGGEGQSALLLVVTYRDDEADRSGRLRQNFLALRDQSLSTRIALERLSKSVCAEMLVSMLHGGELPSGLLDAVFQESRGNPFLTEQYARFLSEGGLLGQAGGRWSLRPLAEEHEQAGGGLRIPPAVRRAYESRLSSVSPLGGKVAQAAAILGADLPFQVLGEVADLDEEALLDGLDELIKRGVLQAVGDATAQFRFVHPLYARLIEHGLDPAARTELHLRAGRALELRHLKELPSVAERLGRHFREAGAAQDAAQYELLAADRFKSLFLFDQALLHYNLAYETGSAALTRNERWAAPMLLKIYRNRGEVHQVLGDYGQAEGDFERLLHLARYLDDTRAAALAHQQLGVIKAGRGASADAYQHYQQATALFAEVRDNAGVADMLLYLGLFIQVQGRFKEALEYLEGALQIKESLGDPVGVAAMLNTLGLLHTEQGRFEEALSCLGRSLEVRRETGDKLGLAVTLNNLGYAYASQGFYHEALRFYEESLAVSREIGDRKGVAQTLNNLAGVQTALGDHAQAERWANEALEIFRELGLQLDIAGALNSLGVITGKRASYDQALIFGVEALGIRRRLQHRAGIAESLKNLADVYRQLADSVRAMSHLREAAEIQSEIGARGPLAEMACVEGHILLAMGKEQEALATFQQGLETARETGERLQEMNLRLGLASVWVRTHKLAEARAAAAEALQMSVEAGFLWVAVAACALLGQIELEAGETDTALEHIDTAIAEASKMGLTEQLLLAWRLRARAYLQAGNPSEALLSSERATDLADKIRKSLYGKHRETFLSRSDVREVVRGYASLLVMAGQPAEAEKARELFEVKGGAGGTESSELMEATAEFEPTR
jgi:tetratricopeptide (TPR) repeat protein